MTHTPTPWEVYSHKIGDDLTVDIRSLNGTVVKWAGFDCLHKAEANAAHIVKCVNEYDSLKAKADMFDELVEGLTKCRNGFKRKLEQRHDVPYTIYRLKEFDDLIKQAKEIT